VISDKEGGGRSEGGYPAGDFVFGKKKNRGVVRTRIRGCSTFVPRAPSRGKRKKRGNKKEAVANWGHKDGRIPGDKGK